MFVSVFPFKPEVGVAKSFFVLNKEVCDVYFFEPAFAVIIFVCDIL